jgi:hypothetical protein
MHFDLIEKLIETRDRIEPRLYIYKVWGMRLEFAFPGFCARHVNRGIAVHWVSETSVSLIRALLKEGSL